MKFLLLKDHNERKQNIIDSISEFLWDSGHEVVKRIPDYNIDNTEEDDDYDYILTIGDISEASDKSSHAKYNNFSLMVRVK
ncbi:hypothetical protein ABEG63_17840 [Chryseobacterium sp. C39-AII1]|uniref:hypothetical protein n=1 Tax=Chryseobacterium sp. C39-AII1 TaxID=3080332 RepID=UPI0032092532